MPTYSRRSALRLTGLAAVSAVAGCGSDGGESPSTARTTGSTASDGAPGQTTGSEPTASGGADDTLAMGTTVSSEDGRSVTVARARLQSIVVTPDEGSGSHARPVGRAGTQFLTVDVSTGRSDIDGLALDAVLDGDPQGSSAVRHNFRPGTSGPLSLAVPVTDVRQGAVEWEPTSGERHLWELPAPVVSSVGSAPAFDAVTFDVPASQASGEPFTATLTVSNGGDRDGVFRAMVLDEGASSLPLAGSIAVSVGADETVTRDISGATLTTTGSDVTAVLDWGLGERRATVSVTA